MAALGSAPLAAQGPKIVPPRACAASPRQAALVALPPAIPHRQARDRIAVLPFDENIADIRLVHGGWSIADYLTRTLPRTVGARVPSPGTIARAWIATDGSLDRLASLVGADFIVTGQTATRGGSAEITVSVWDAASADVRWSRVYEYPKLSLREIEDSVTAKLGTLLGTQSRALTRSTEYSSVAYDEMARGDYYLHRPGVDGVDSARAAYSRAVTADPKLAIAKVRLARSLAMLVERSAGTARPTPDRRVDQGLLLLDAALALDPKAAEAWTVRGMLLRLQDPQRYSGAVAAHERAVALDSDDADAQHEFGQTLLLLGNDAAANEHFRRAVELEPNRASTLRSYAELEMLARRYEASCAFANASIAANQYDPLSYAVRAQVRLQLGEFRDAYADAEIAARLSGERWGAALKALVVAGARDVERAKRETRRLARSRLQPSAVFAVREARYLAAALALIGDDKNAVDALSRARPRGAELRTALRDPNLDSLRRERRFRDMMRPGLTVEGTRDGGSH